MCELINILALQTFPIRFLYVTISYFKVAPLPKKIKYIVLKNFI